MAMTTEHRDILRNNHVRLVEDLMLNEELLSVLLSRKTFSNDMKEIVEAEKTRKDRARHLMKILPSRGDAAFGVFVEALVESWQEPLARILDGALCERYVRRRDENYATRAPDTRTSELDVRNRINVAPFPVDEGSGGQGGGAIQNNRLPEGKTWLQILFGSEDQVDRQVDLNELDLNPMRDEQRKKVAQMTDNYMAYKMEKANPDGRYGRAVIINNVFFDYLNPRDGSNADRDNLVRLFEELHFETEVHNNRTDEQMKSIMEKESRNPKHSQYSAFVLCVLSHGCRNKIFGRNGRVLKTKSGQEIVEGTIDMDEVTSTFSGRSCPGLAGKPKLFFIQACQGEAAMGLVSVDPISTPERQPTRQEGAGDLRDDSQVPTEQSTDSDGGLPSVVGSNKHQVERLHTPEAADLLVAFSTAPGYKSWRHTSLGSWFIRCLIYIIRNNACSEHLLDILTQVSCIVSEFKTFKDYKYAVQVPQIVSTLTKKVYFVP